MQSNKVLCYTSACVIYDWYLWDQINWRLSLLPLGAVDSRDHFRRASLRGWGEPVPQGTRPCRRGQPLLIAWGYPHYLGVGCHPRLLESRWLGLENLRQCFQNWRKKEKKISMYFTKLTFVHFTIEQKIIRNKHLFLISDFQF